MLLEIALALTLTETEATLQRYYEHREILDQRIQGLEAIIKREKLGQPRVTPLKCLQSQITPSDPIIASYMRPDGSEAYVIDKNGDGKKDAVLVVPNDGNPYPLHYLFDLDYDGMPDIAYQDNDRNGECNNVEHDKPKPDRRVGE